MHNSTSTVRSATRLSTFAMATLWHRRLSRTRAAEVRVQPRVCAELILHPVVSHGQQVNPRSTSKDDLDACHAA